ncbi:MAG TPA: hypothetical protein DIW64_08900 [Cellvibrio sp.]|nr:hypothetical protein [Cellvibrio sp.]
MRKVAFISGVICLIYVVFGLLLGLLPVQFWSYIIDLFVERKPGEFYKIVPTAGAGFQIALFTVVGIILIVLSKFKLPNRKGKSL